MKKLLVFLLVVGGGGTGGYYLATGRLPWVMLSAEEQQILGLRDELGRIRQQWQQAGKSQSFGVVDTGSMVDGTLARLDQLEKDIGELAPKLKSPEARTQAANLRQEIAAFRTGMR